MLRFIWVTFFAILFLAAEVAGARSTARAALGIRMPEAKLIDVPLVDAIQFLRDVSNVNVDVNWKALETVGVEKNALVNINLHDVTVAKVLDLSLAQAAPGDLLTWYVDGNVVEVTTRQIADAKMITIVYDVTDLLQPNPQFDPTINATGGTAQVTSGGGGGGSSSAITSGGTTANANMTQAQLAQNLIMLIEKLIRPEVWRDNGGTASMDFLNGNLIVTAPRSVQEAIGGPVD
jgi:hypothetical protein